MNKIGIIGCGNVGLAIIHEFVTLDLDLEILIIDHKKEATLSNIDDFNHVLSKTKLTYGDYSSIDDCDYLVITTGIKMVDNRELFLKNSYLMIKDVMTKINKTSFHGYIIVVSNPNDVLTTYIAQNYDYRKVIGTGCYLDTKRLHYYLSNQYNLPLTSVDGLVIGEHGPEQRILWDYITFNKKPKTFSAKEKKVIAEYVKTIASKIVAGKGFTNYAIASCVRELLVKMVNNQSFSLIASTYHVEDNIAYSMPLIYHNKKLSIDNHYIINDKSFIDKIKKEFSIFNQELIIGLDLDDTITYLQDEMSAKAALFDQENNGTGLKYPDQYYVGEKYGWDAAMKDQFFLTYRKDIIRHAKLRTGVCKYLKKWQAEGYKIYIITARNRRYYEQPYQETYDWLTKHKVPFDKLIVESYDKKDICLNNHINYFIDDDVNNCLAVKELHNVKVLLMINGNNEKNNELVKVRSFQEIDEVIHNV